MRRGRADHARHGDTEASPRPQVKTTAPWSRQSAPPQTACERTLLHLLQAPGAQTSTAAGPSSASYAASGPLDAGGANSSDQDTTSMGFHFNIPSAYFSTTAKQQAHCWVHDGQGMVYKEVSYCPLLHQVADVVLAGVAHTKLLTGEPPKEVFVTLDKVGEQQQGDSTSLPHPRHCLLTSTAASLDRALLVSQSAAAQHSLLTCSWTKCMQPGLAGWQGQLHSA